MAYARDLPYNDLPLLPPKAELETRDILKQVTASSRALADLRGLARMIPNQGILINGIVLQEARLSSEIENIVTTSDELYRAAADADGGSDPSAKEVLRYREALWHGFQEIRQRPLTTNLFIEIVRIIKKTDLDVRKTTGTKLANHKTSEVIYTPPEGEAVIRNKLANLEQFLYPDPDDGLDPLIRLAVMHYQFEAIHPFPDGNGRTGRILNILLLVEHKLLDIPVLYLSRYILENRASYYEGLRRVTEEGAWENWVLYILKAIETTARETQDRVQQILTLMEDVRVEVQEKAPRIYSKDLIEIVFRHPYCKIKFVEEAGKTTRQTASAYLKVLSELGILRLHKMGRDVYYINDQLLHVLTK
ncbi:MAG: Fic family protein [Gallionella sp.]|jgi:Fic family protein|nr:Fic family protein [Gallionella sp.]MCK9352776.1 Fic family protein [Gallionella sp.]